MKQMLKILTIAAAAVAVASLSSCSDFLDQEPKTRLTEESVLAEAEYAAPMVSGLYFKYRESRIGRDGLTINIGTDEAQQGYFQLVSEGSQAGYDKYNMLLSPTTNRLNVVWSRRFPHVVDAGKLIKAMSSNLNPTEHEKVLLGESHFMRGLGMFELSMFFGEIPISDPGNVTDAKRQPLPLVWEYIISDFTKAAELLPVMQTSPERATKGAAYAMLGKAYMCDPNKAVKERDYAAAKKAFEELMKLGRYQLVTDYASLFANDRKPDIWVQNSSESIFELQFTHIPSPDNNFWQWDCGSRMVASFFDQKCYFAGWDFFVPTPWAYSSVDSGGVWEKGDKRRNVVIRYDFSYDEKNNGKLVTPDMSKLQWRGGENDTMPGNVQDEKHPHIRKFEDYRTDQYHEAKIADIFRSGKNHPLIRLADIYLLYAECLHYTGESGLLGGKEWYVKEVRKRAFDGDVPDMPLTLSDVSNGDAFIDAILDERTRELGFEGWRRIDLLRTDLLLKRVAKLNRWANKEYGGGAIPDHYKRYPIPASEIKTNPDITDDDQNPGYK